MIERLEFGNGTAYSAVEATIHLNRYAISKPYIAGKRVLDVASGEGYGSYLLKKWGALHVEAIDVDEKTAKKAQKVFGSEDVHFQCHTAEELPFEDYSFDVVCSFETIEHLDHPERFLKEIKRVLKPDGIVILSCPNDPYYYKQGTPGNPFHKRQYTFFDFKSEAEAVLGSHVQYYLAFALNGFVNVPIGRATFPPEGEMPDSLPRDMFEMLNYDDCVNSVFVSGERYLNYWNSNYYVGIWGAIKNPEINVAVYPRETFIELKDEDIAFYLEAHRRREELEELQKTLIERQQMMQKQLEYKDTLLKNSREREEELLSLMGDKDREYARMLAEKEEVCRLIEQKELELAALTAKMDEELQRACNREEELKRMLDAKEKELPTVREEVDTELVAKLQTEICDLKEQLSASESYIEHLKNLSKKELHVAQLEQQRTSMMLELVTKEKEYIAQSAYSNYESFVNANSTKDEVGKWGQRMSNELWEAREELKRVNRELELIKSSRGFKLLNVGFPIKQRIWKLFGKNI